MVLCYLIFSFSSGIDYDLTTYKWSPTEVLQKIEAKPTDAIDELTLSWD